MNLAALDLVSLRLAVVCADLGSLSAAAARVHLSVSGASHRLTALEAALGRQLFRRHSRGLAPTDAGELVVEQGRLVLSAIEDIQDRLHV